MARLHLRTALFAYAGIFPPEAPPPTLPEVTEQWRAWLQSSEIAGLVAESETAMVGVGLAGPDPGDPARGHISRLYVDPDLWGRGIGRALLDAGLSYLVEQGFTEATLWVLERNQRARSWYERLGWRLTGERKPVFEPAGIVDVRYRKAL